MKLADMWNVQSLWYDMLWLTWSLYTSAILHDYYVATLCIQKLISLFDLNHRGIKSEFLIVSLICRYNNYFPKFGQGSYIVNGYLHTCWYTWLCHYVIVHYVIIVTPSNSDVGTLTKPHYHSPHCIIYLCNSAWLLCSSFVYS